MDEQDKIFAIADRITKYNFKTIWDMEGDVMLQLKKEEIDVSRIQKKLDKVA